MSEVTHGGNVFAAARELGCDWRDVLDFSASINPLGPSPHVRPAIIEALDRIVHYPDSYSERLRAALSEEWQVAPERIILGNGATDLIHFLARVWPVPVTLVVPVFAEFYRAYRRARRLACGDIADQGNGMTVYCNPVNPTGAAAFIRPRPAGYTLVDESFIEFTSLPSRMHSERTIVLRSLTKFHALPGLRIGALIGPEELVAKWRALREPWQVNVLAEAAALAALADKDHQVHTLRFVNGERQRIWSAFASIPGVRLHESCANYFMASLTYPAALLCGFFYKHKLLVRNCTGMPGVEGEAVRFAIRTRQANDKLIELWRTYRCDC